jgi:hypothetical protein
VNTGAGVDGWISGLGFSSNPWNHAYNSAVAYHWNMNGGTALPWDGGNENWNNDIIVRIPPGVNILTVPVVPSGVDKLFYIVEHNNNWDGFVLKSISVEDKKIERFRTTWDNPLARHHNSKIYSRFIAARIPASFVAGKNFIKITIDTTGSNHSIYIREAGTVDLY